MPKYLIERQIPGLGRWTPDQIRQASEKSNLIIRELGGEITWITSYVTDDKLYCVFVAPSEDVVIEHARCLDIPADRISRVASNIDPASAE
jgi:hypothetical protein